MIKKIIFLLFLAVFLLLPTKRIFALQVKSYQKNNQLIAVSRNEVINDNLVIYGDTIGVDGHIKGDLIAFGNTITVNGQIDGNLITAGRTIVISGNILRDSLVGGDNLTLANTAKISGNLYAGLNKFTGDRNLVSQKSIIKINSRINPLNQIILSFLTSLLTGLILIKLFNKTAQALTPIAKSKWGVGILSGLMLLIITPIIVATLVATIIGLPLAIIISLFYLIDIYLSTIVVAIVLGDLISKHKLGLPRQFTIGLLVIYLLRFSTILSGITNLIILLFGFGLIIQAKIVFYKKHKLDL